MKKYGLYLMMVAVTLFCTTSCGDDEEVNPLEGWMIANQNALNAIKADPKYKELKSPGNEGSIYYRVLKEGDGTAPILYTSRVEVYYKGSFSVNSDNLLSVTINKGDVFDSRLFDDGPPLKFAVSPALADYSSSNPNGYMLPITGWKTALQSMSKGDKWEVWIPYQLAYGRINSGSIPGYSTLVFEIEVVSVKNIDDK